MGAKKPGQRVDKTGRSKGDGPHVRFYRWELESPAFNALSVGARALLLELKALYNGSNNGQLFLSWREAGRRLGVGKNTAGRYFEELRALGFIRPHRVGAFNLKHDARRGNATSWVLAEFGFAGALATKDFMHWRPERTAKNQSTASFQRQAVPGLEPMAMNNNATVPTAGALAA